MCYIIYYGTVILLVVRFLPLPLRNSNTNNYSQEYRLRLLEFSQKKYSNLAIKINHNKKEVYFKYSYPMGAIGPLLFVGQMQCCDLINVVKIKIGPLSATFILVLFMYPILSGKIFADPIFQITNILFLIVIVVCFYILFSNVIKKAISNGEKETTNLNS